MIRLDVLSLISIIYYELILIPNELSLFLLSFSTYTDRSNIVQFYFPEGNNKTLKFRLFLELHDNE